ncbi:MAG: amidohydrolase [Rubricoccaceae bacterium]
MRVFALLIALLPLLASAQPPMPSGATYGEEGYVVHNATVYTGFANAPTVEAFAVQAGRIRTVGSESAVFTAYPDWPRVDAGGRTIIPGLIDAHAHLMGLGTSLLQADLVGTASKAEIVERLQAFAADLPEGAWVTGRGWDQNDWGGDGAFPTRADLDTAFPDRPVWLSRVDGHADWANTAALRAAGIDPEAAAPEDPEGGAVIQDEQGRPTGVFIDAAAGLVQRAVPAPDQAFYTEALERALQETVRYGLTGIHEAGVSLSTLDLYRQFAEEGRFPIRNYAMITPGEIDAFCEAHPYGVDEFDSRLVVQSVKLYADGALGSRGAALHDPYADDPGNRGLLFQSSGELYNTVYKAMACNLQVNTHAIGDRANSEVLQAYTSVMDLGIGIRRRHRIEHAQILRLQDIDTFSQYGIIASVQPTHATSDMPWVEARVGERAIGAYAWRRLLDAGVQIALGSDFPVERVNPLLGFYAAVTRQDLEGMPEGGWFGDQVLTRQEALHGFTLGAAYAASMEAKAGAILPGRYADFVILSHDIMQVPAEEILDTAVLATYIGGERVYVAE